ncbi:MAG: hypothetical protein H6953_09890 [Chromatiaceae bacterium]|nr:hypothetical protein [Gammaproteobacteria bacterium]MCP5305748.1 hypothetical protein [Chromatiaceae bacterium]MCP5312605.1 hypothetical protein [Chromatiaceae bacterium]
MADFELSPDMHVTPSPAGAYYAVFSPEQDVTRRVLFGLMRSAATHPLDVHALKKLTAQDANASLELLYRMQSLNLLQGFDDVQHAPQGPLDQLLPAILKKLAGQGKALLADGQGFYAASHGYHHETAEELSALSADLATLHERHHQLLNRNMSLHSSAWGLIDAGGTSQVGFWPLYIGTQRFVLVLSGVPNMNRPELVDLVWALSLRYAEGQPE